jgi:TonB family protein
MSLRCLLFTADAATAGPICQVLAGLGVEGEHCTEAVSAVEKVTNQPFQIVIIDWDAQPEAGLLLTTARERKASARPLTLAIVSDDASVPKALQAGANSILRKPILINQVNDTLTTARDLLRAKQESAAAAGASASSASASSSIAPVSNVEASEKTLRAGEFLQPSGTIPGAHFVTDSDVHHDADPSADPVDALEDLEPVASSVVASEPRDEKPAPLPPPAPGETRGLQWYLNARAGVAPQVPAQAAPPPSRPAKPELLGFDQTPSNSDNQSAIVSDDTAWAPTPAPRSALPTAKQDPEHEQKAEAKLFAYISGEEEKPEETPRRTFKLKGPIVAALALAACAVVAAPQAPWHPQVLALLGHGQRSLHTWLNPQPVTTAPAPESHESFGRAGDEYKLPVVETIPDATTDPSQIHVVPVIDPTKKPNTANPDQPAVQDPANTNPTDPAQMPTQSQPDPGAGNAVQPNQTPVQQNSAPDNQSAPQSAPPATQSSPTVTMPAATQPAVEPPQSETRTEITPPPIAARPAPRPSPPHTAAAPANVPSSLKSQMASMTPEASGNKPPEAAMQAIEPVAVTEAAERALLTDQPAIDYPANAKGQQGTVILQVLIGRDGAVQDAKFLQGSLAFARTAIDGVKLWKFKPYSMNGRPVSVQTSLTMSFKPGS